MSFQLAAVMMMEIIVGLGADSSRRNSYARTGIWSTVGAWGQSDFDFVYLPDDFKKNRDTGYRPAEFGRSGPCIRVRPVLQKLYTTRRSGPRGPSTVSAATSKLICAGRSTGRSCGPQTWFGPHDLALEFLGLRRCAAAKGKSLMSESLR